MVDRVRLDDVSFFLMEDTQRIIFEENFPRLSPLVIISSLVRLGSVRLARLPMRLLFLTFAGLLHVPTSYRGRLEHHKTPMDIALNALFSRNVPTVPTCFLIYSFRRPIYTRAYFIGIRLERLEQIAESPVVIGLKRVPTFEKQVGTGWNGWNKTCKRLQITMLLARICKFSLDENPF